MTFNSLGTHYDKVYDQPSFIVSELFTIAAGETANIHLENPTDSGYNFWIDNIGVSSDNSYIAHIHDDFSDAPSGGTDVTIQNVYLDKDKESDEGAGNANQNVTYTSISEHAVGVGGGGAKKTFVGGASAHPPAIIGEGREIVVEVENTTAESGNYGIMILYYQTKRNGI